MADFSQFKDGTKVYDVKDAVARQMGEKANSAVQTIQIDGVTQTKTDGTVNLPAYPTTLPASDVSSWAKAATKPSYTASEVGAATSAQGTKADTAVQTIKIGGAAQTKTDGIVNLPAYPTSLPASDVSSWAKAASKPTYTASEVGAATSAQGSKADSAVQTIQINGVAQAKTNGTVNLPAYPTSLPASDVSSWAKASSKPTYTATEVGAIAATAKGANGGVAELDSAGKVPSSQLPSFVDDVLEYSSKSSFPTTGEAGKIYIDTATNLSYRWGGTAYAEISPSIALGETSSTAYRGDRGKAAYDHISDTTKHITSTERSTWNGAVQTIQIGGTAQTKTNGVVNLPAYPTTLPASDVAAWAKASTKPSYTAAEVGAATSAQGSKADSAIQTIQIGGTAQTKTNGVVNLPAYPTSLPASNTTDSYSATGTAPVSGKAIAAALGTLDVSSVGGSGKFIQSISETDGKISAIAGTMPTSLPASDVSAWAKAATKPTYTASEVGLGNVGNFKAVSTVASQGLSSTEQANARANIGAGTSSFSGSYNDLSNKPTIPAKSTIDILSSDPASPAAGYMWIVST